jgi:hypothetical protein
MLLARDLALSLACVTRRYAWSSSRALEGYKEETTSDPTLNAEIETLFRTLPRETRLECDRLNHSLTLIKYAPFKDVSKAAQSRATPIKLQTSNRRVSKRPDPLSYVINVDAEASGSASPAPTPRTATSSRAARPTTTSSPDHQDRWKVLLDRLADEMIEAGSVSDITNRDVMRGMLAMAVKRSGLLLPLEDPVAM